MMNGSFVLVLWLSAFCLSQSATAQSTYSLRSPDQRIEVRVRAADRLSYDVLLNGNLLLKNSTLSMNINHANLDAHPRVKATKQRSENKMGHDHRVTIKDIDRTKKLTISLASGGGWAARIYKK